MSYLVLARKYRPRSFGEVTGQEVVTRTLQGAIEEGRAAHAYLFCGPRGTGKTTTARLFAKALNCEQGPAADPCGTCARCTGSDAGSETDIIEIDAASHTGVDNVRELRDQAAFAPMVARHKIYIIDEVHMLSRAAFNALLKTLEEPPAHVKFLFATTEPHKVPDTILSRCQVLKLSALSEPAIEARLDEVFTAEGIQAEAGVSAAIARRARGGMRDALSLADQLLALVGEAPSLDDTERLTAGTDRAGVERLVRALVSGDRPAVLSALGEGPGGEAEWLDALLEFLRGSLLAAHCGPENPLSEAPAEARANMGALAKELGPERLELWLEDLLAAREALRLQPAQGRLTLELCLLRLARPEATIFPSARFVPGPPRPGGSPRRPGQAGAGPVRARRRPARKRLGGEPASSAGKPQPSFRLRIRTIRSRRSGSTASSTGCSSMRRPTTWTSRMPASVCANPLARSSPGWASRDSSSSTAIPWGTGQTSVTNSSCPWGRGSGPGPVRSGPLPWLASGGKSRSMGISPWRASTTGASGSISRSLR